MEREREFNNALPVAESRRLAKTNFNLCIELDSRAMTLDADMPIAEIDFDFRIQTLDNNLPRLEYHDYYSSFIHTVHET